MDFDDWNATVDAIYAAASAPRLWPDALQRIATLLDADGGTLLYRQDNGSFGVIVSPALSEMAKVYDASWRHRDVRAERAFREFATGQRDVVTDRDFFSDHEIATLPIYQEFLLPHGYLWTIAASVSPTPSVTVAMSMLRTKDKPRYGEAEHAQMQALSRHVERSLSLSIRLMDAEAERLGLAKALDLVDCGAFILDADHTVLFANKTAKSVLGAGLVVSGGQLRAVGREAQEGLEALLASVANPAAPAGTGFQSLVVPNGDRGLVVQAMPLHLDPAGAEPLRKANAIVLVIDQDTSRPFDPAVVRDVYQLTLGEARLAAIVGSGASPREAASALGLTEETARTVLKRVFAKMDISRQGELAALMGKLFMLRRQ